MPPKGVFAAHVGNVPYRYMRAHIMAFSDTESWRWQLPDVAEGQTISFRMIEAVSGSGVPPQYVRKRDAEEIAENRRMAEECYARAMNERHAANGVEEGIGE